MFLGKLPVPGRPTIWMIVGQGPIALAGGGAGGGLCGDFYSPLSFLFSFSLSLSLWETARYRLKYCFKGPLNPEQPTNQLLLKLLGQFQFNFICSLQAKRRKVDIHGPGDMTEMVGMPIYDETFSYLLLYNFLDACREIWF